MKMTLSQQNNTPTKNASDMDRDLLSPNAMAEAACAAAIAIQSQQQSNHNNKKSNGKYDENTNIETKNSSKLFSFQLDNHPNKRQRVCSSFGDTVDDSQNSLQEMVQQIQSIWDFDTLNERYSKTEDEFIEEKLIKTALRKTSDILDSTLNSIVKAGLDAFHRYETQKRELKHIKELADSREKEIKRLQTLDDESRSSISNLLRAIEASKSDAQNSCRAAQTEVQLRNEIVSLRSERDDALASSSEMKRRLALVEEESKLLKNKLTRIVQDRIKMERDSRAAISLARSLDNHNHSDVNFYKRKVGDLNDRLRSKQELLVEQQQEIEDLRKQVGRHSSHNKLIKINLDDAGYKTRRQYR